MRTKPNGKLIDGTCSQFYSWFVIVGTTIELLRLCTRFVRVRERSKQRRTLAQQCRNFTLLDGRNGLFFQLPAVRSLRFRSSRSLLRNLKQSLIRVSPTVNSKAVRPTRLRLLLPSRPKAGFIAGQLNSTRRRVELCRRVAMNDALSRYEHPPRRCATPTERRRSSPTLRRQFWIFQNSTTQLLHSYSQSARSRSVRWLLFIYDCCYGCSFLMSTFLRNICINLMETIITSVNYRIEAPGVY